MEAAIEGRDLKDDRAILQEPDSAVARLGEQGAETPY